ncbi:hypothetical protein ZWY2020_028039 [Hordeum vulgare]|nr:hypothetical protein ZWY2020_028039 [Hordeum vulgare]
MNHLPSVPVVRRLTNSEVDDVQVPSQKLDYTKRVNEVDIHDKEKLDVVCTNNPDEADEMIYKIRKRVGGLYPWYIGVDVEYTREDEPPWMVGVLQLCMEELCVFLELMRPKGLRPLLKEDMLYTFVGFSIEGHKHKLNESCLEINPDKYIDIQRKWIVPYMGRKRFHSLADVADSVIHLFYKRMKQNIHRGEDHKLWGIIPLPDYLIKYAVIDACATYESWKKIENIRIGLECSKAKESEKDYDNPYYSYYDQE